MDDSQSLNFSSVSATARDQATRHKLGDSELHALADAIISTVPNPLLVLDKDLAVVLANDAYYNQFRVVPLHTIGQTLWKLGGGQWDTPGLRHLISDIIPRGSSLVNYEVSSNFPIIGHRTLRLNGRAVFPKASEIKYLLLVFQDITAERAAEQQLQKLNLELRRRNEEVRIAYDELQTFSYSVSHDLRSPLRAIDGFSQAIQTDFADKLNDTGRDYLARIRRGAARMSELIDAMLELSRIGRAAFNATEVDLRSEAADIMAELKRMEPARQAEFILPDRAVVTGDQRLLRIVLTNLFTNAWKFTSRNAQTTIEFGVQKDQSGEIYFVRDNGIGFDQRHAEKIFQPFSQLRSADYPGSGIGLTTTFRVIRRHGGRIWAEGERNKGATIYFTLGMNP